MKYERCFNSTKMKSDPNSSQSNWCGESCSTWSPWRRTSCSRTNHFWKFSLIWRESKSSPTNPSSSWMEISWKCQRRYSKNRLKEGKRELSSLRFLALKVQENPPFSIFCLGATLEQVKADAQKECMELSLSFRIHHPQDVMVFSLLTHKVCLQM